MSTSWILIANASKAQIYTTHKARLFKTNGHDEENISLVKAYQHNESRKRAQDLVSDRCGNYTGSSGLGHGSMIEPTDPKATEAARFARELAQVLETGRVEGCYDDLIIVAEPRFRGLLNKHLNGQLSRLISHTIPKDYTHMSGRVLAQQLRENL